MPPVSEHPPRDELEAFALGRLDDAVFAAVEEHVAVCADCEAVVSRAPGDSFTTLLRAAQSLSDTPLSMTGDATFVEPVSEAGGATGAWSVPAAEGRPNLPPALANHPRYHPVRLLGHGGMGAVWLAEHRVMGRQVAVKAIRPEFISKPGAADRFRREAHAAGQLRHPNIVAAFDAEQAGDTHLLAMEYIEGVNLADELRRRGPLPVAAACDVVRQAALGLQHAFERGLIHRDLKPHNLMRTADGTVKILDFGLAVLADAGERAGGLTGENVVLGTPDYIAPEQAEDSHAADIRSDIYALGCTLYHLLTGRPPFPDESVLRKLDGHRTREPEPMRRLRPEVPAGLAAVVARMMAKKPANRFQTPAEVAAALAPFAAGTAPVRNRRWPWVAVAALLLAGIVAAAGVVYRIQTDNGEVVITPESPDVEIALLKGGKEVAVIDTKTNKRVTVPTGGYDVAVKGKPDGIEVKTDRIVVLRGKEALVTIERVAKPTPPAPAANEIQILQRVPIPEGGRVLGLASFGDGKFLTAQLFAPGSEEGDFVVWDAQTAKELYRRKATMNQHLFPQPFAVTPDGKRIVTVDGDAVVVRDFETGGELLKLAQTPKLISAGILPDGQHLVVWTSDEQGKTRELRLEEWPGGKVLHTWPNAYYSVATPDGRALFVMTRGEKTFRVWDLQKNQPSDEFAQLAKFQYIDFGPGKDQALVQEGEEEYLVDMAGARLAGPLPRFKMEKRFNELGGTWAENVNNHLLVLNDGTVRVYDRLTAKEYGACRLPDVGNRPVEVYLAPGGRLACVATEQSLYLLRLPDPPAKDEP
jgi:hypothetical protein